MRVPLCCAPSGVRPTTPGLRPLPPLIRIIIIMPGGQVMQVVDKDREGKVKKHNVM